jgi:3-oxoacyl-[acyl-carrier-protein] synthase II
MVRQVAITGVGVISSLGTGERDFFRGLIAGSTSFCDQDFTDERFASSLSLHAAYVQEFSAAEHLGRKGLRNLSRESQLFMSAAMLASADAKCLPQSWERPLVGICCGSVFSGYENFVGLFADSLAYGIDRINPAQGPQTGFNAPASQLAIFTGAEGPNVTVTTGIASGLDALIEASDLIISEHADMMLAGGVEAYAFFSAQVLNSLYGPRNSARALRPFDIDRQGTVFGEAGAVLVLEDSARARARGARIRAIVRGYGCAFRPPTAGLALAAAKAIRQALLEAHLEPSEIDLVIASSNGERQLDAAEAMALHGVFGASVPVYAMKGATGECLGGSGGLQAAAALLCIEKKVVPKTIGYCRRDPVLPPLSVTSEISPNAARHIMIHCLDPGGYSTALILSAYVENAEA